MGSGQRGSDPELEFPDDLDASDHLFAFDGRIDDDAPLGFEHCRWCDPTIGRWMNEEPIGFLDDANVSRYVYDGDGE
jgi:hypothetical protein